MGEEVDGICCLDGEWRPPRIDRNSLASGRWPFGVNRFYPYNGGYLSIEGWNMTSRVVLNSWIWFKTVSQIARPVTAIGSAKCAAGRSAQGGLGVADQDERASAETTRCPQEH